ncbi:low molecular weight phosphatase family protein [Cryobacterium sp. SO2]|uniref:arsenate reductase/protein-tyrosine-phosphatase family protein n=1 Tax=Cryobacterium sp. SO2 TaxID=1897060 RepID=UPI00223DFB8B|nr:low molecular weight phosphatase family protein [Cryobacterium sp. SO2]WEO78036.1 low molecular weight phosphatase family protein [Cryobacterium sp. SO2]
MTVPTGASTTADGSSSRPARILTVCTGNVCRSPMAEAWLRAGLANVEVASAGTGALVGGPMEPIGAEIVRQLGADASTHRARQLTGPILEGAGLVLTLSRTHSAEVLELSPGLTRRVFTLREFAALIDDLGVHRLAQLGASDDPEARLAKIVDLASLQRTAVRLPADESLDVLDPYRRPQAVWVSSARQIRPAVLTIVHALSAAGL